jgi:hypothetical protein
MRNLDTLISASRAVSRGESVRMPGLGIET